MDLCRDCGNKKYPNADKNKMNGITVSLGECPECKKQAGIIPEGDWLYASGQTSMWD